MKSKKIETTSVYGKITSRIRCLKERVLSRSEIISSVTDQRIACCSDPSKIFVSAFAAYDCNAYSETWENGSIKRLNDLIVDGEKWLFGDEDEDSVNSIFHHNDINILSIEDLNAYEINGITIPISANGVYSYWGKYNGGNRYRLVNGSSTFYIEKVNAILWRIVRSTGIVVASALGTGINPPLSAWVPFAGSSTTKTTAHSYQYTIFPPATAVGATQSKLGHTIFMSVRPLRDHEDGIDRWSIFTDGKLETGGDIEYELDYFANIKKMDGPIEVYDLASTSPVAPFYKAGDIVTVAISFTQIGVRVYINGVYMPLSYLGTINPNIDSRWRNDGTPSEMCIHLNKDVDVEFMGIIEGGISSSVAKNLHKYFSTSSYANAGFDQICSSSSSSSCSSSSQSSSSSSCSSSSSSSSYSSSSSSGSYSSSSSSSSSSSFSGSSSSSSSSSSESSSSSSSSEVSDSSSSSSSSSSSGLPSSSSSSSSSGIADEPFDDGFDDGFGISSSSSSSSSTWT